MRGRAVDSPGGPRALVHISSDDTRRDIVRALEEAGYAVHEPASEVRSSAGEHGGEHPWTLVVADPAELPIAPASDAFGAITLAVMAEDADADQIAATLADRAADVLVPPVSAAEIAGRVSAARRRRRSECSVRSIVAHVPLLLLYVDPAGTIQLAEGKGLELLELESRRVVNLSIFELFEDRPELLADVRRALAGESFRGKLRIGERSYETSFHPVALEDEDGDGDESGVALALVDVSEHTRTEDALRRSEASFRTLIESSPDAVFVHRFGRLVYVNATALSLIGCGDAGELIGRPMLDLVAEADRDAAGAQIRKVVADGEVVTHEVRLIRGDETPVTTEMRAMSFTFDGEPAVLAAARDITERKRLQSRLLQTDRLASLGTMAAGVAHQINNPLAYMINNLLFLRDELKRLTGPEPAALSEDERVELRAALKDTLDGAERVRQIVRHLGAFARPHDDAGGQSSVAEAVDAAIRMAWHQLRRVSQVSLDYRELPIVRAGSAGLGQVFFHLLVNAAQAVEARGPEDRNISVTVRVDDGHAVVEVTDNGPGIAPSALASIFDPFFTTRPVGHGSGLGLSVCHSIATSVGGTIDVTSEPDRGCTFSVRLPLDLSANRTLEPVRERRRFLVLENETWTLHVLQDALRGHPIALAPDEGSALRAAGRDPFDVVLCDVGVISVSVERFHEQLRACGVADDRIVLLTHDDGDVARLAGAAVHELRKPFKSAAVVELMGDIGLL